MNDKACVFVFTITVLGLQSDCQQEITVLPRVALKGMENTIRLILVTGSLSQVVTRATIRQFGGGHSSPPPDMR